MTTINVEFDEYQINVETQEQGPAGVGISWEGAYSAVTAYVVNDAVSYLGSSYICILASTNNLPTNATYWSVMASKGDNGTANITTSTATDISGLLKGAVGFIAQAIADTDYLTPTTAGTTYVAKNAAITGATKTKITYDAKGLVTSGADATTADISDSTDKRYLSDTQKTEATRNASGSQNGLLSSTDWTTFNSKEGALGFTPENVANKENTTLDTSTTKYPTNRLVKEYADSLVAGLLDYRGGYDASVNTFPASGGSGTAGAVIKGDMWALSVAGTLGGTAVQIGDSIIANVDTPGQTAGNWNILNSNISYVPEDQANKETSALDASVTKYPCNNVVKSAIEARYAILEDKTSDYTANSTNSGKMWMRSDATSSTMKGIIKTSGNGITAKVLVVGGGGSGGLDLGGGGGAGGLLYDATYAITNDTEYTVTVGAGGAAVAWGGSELPGLPGSNSVFGTLTAIGGGGGKNRSGGGTPNGGSGGGGSSQNETGGAGTSLQGNDGGNAATGDFSCGGGGGAGAVGSNGVGGNPGGVGGNGGVGLAYSITGSSVYYAGGGGGGCYAGGTVGAGGNGGGGAGSDGGAATAGTANTGGGGGGVGTGTGTSGAGGSGVVIISYVGSAIATGGTITTSGGNTIHTFTSSGSFIVGVAGSSIYTNEQFTTKTYVDSLISDTAYDATSWNGATTIAPSKNAVRDKIEALDTAKVNANVAITGATKTKVTYDTKGLITSGIDATTADIADSTDKRYVTDANLTVIGNTSGTNTGDNTNHATFSNIAWTSSGHTGSNLGAPLFDGTGVATQVVPTAGQSVRINAGGTAWEAYTPGSGLSWGASVNGATGTGVALAMDNAYAASGIGLSITIGNTQTNALTGLKIDTGTDTSPQQKAITLTHLNGYGIQANMTSSQAVSYTYGFIHGTNYNTNSSNYTWGINLVVENNAGAGTNTGMYIDNKSTEFTAGTYAGLAILQEGVGGTAISVGTGQSVNTGTNGLVNYTLDNTQSGASIVQKIGTGTSTQSHIGLLINAYNANTSCAGVKIDGSTTATGYGLEFAGVGASGYKRIRFSNQIVPSGGTSFGIHFGAAISATTGTGNGIAFAGTISGGGGGIGRGIYCATIADNTGGGTGTLIQVDNLIGASSTTAPTAAKYYSFNNNQSAILANLSVDPSEILFSRTCTRTSGTTTDNFNLNYLKRISIQNGAGGTFSTTGTVQKLENVATQTAGTLTDSTVVLSLVQDNDSTGGHILFNSYSGTPTTDGTFWFDGTDFKARVGGATKTFTIA